MIYDADAKHALVEDSGAFKAELRLAQMLDDAGLTLEMQFWADACKH